MYSFVDGWREQNPAAFGASHLSDNEYASASRIDRMYASRAIYPRCYQWIISEFLDLSDHNVVAVEYCPRDRIRVGKGEWTSSLRSKIPIDMHFRKLPSFMN